MPLILELLAILKVSFVKNVEVKAVILFFKIGLHKSVNKDPSVSKYSFNKGNYDAKREHFKDTDWEAMLEGDDIDKSWNLFENSLNGAMKLYIPT